MPPATKIIANLMFRFIILLFRISSEGGDTLKKAKLKDVICEQQAFDPYQCLFSESCAFPASLTGKSDPSTAEQKECSPHHARRIGSVPCIL